MTDQDYAAFGEEFTRLHAALGGFRQSPTEAAAKADAYFHALKRFALSDVIAKADRWLTSESKFPKPVEWASVRLSQAPELPTLTPAEAREWLDAEQRHWEGDPCECVRCLHAGVTELQRIRFVPETTRDGRDRHVKLGERMVTAGHWAHGDELARFYKAKAAAWEAYVALKLHIKADRSKRVVSQFASLADIFARPRPKAAQ